MVCFTVLAKWPVVLWQMDKHLSLPCLFSPSQFTVNFIVLICYNKHLFKEFTGLEMAGFFKPKNSPNGLFNLADMIWREF